MEWHAESKKRPIDKSRMGRRDKIMMAMIRGEVDLGEHVDCFFHRSEHDLDLLR